MGRVGSPSANVSNEAVVSFTAVVRDCNRAWHGGSKKGGLKPLFGLHLSVKLGIHPICDQIVTFLYLRDIMDDVAIAL